MFEVNDTVVLAADVPTHRLSRGAIGAVVFRFSSRLAYDVEFCDDTGRTLAEVSLLPDQLEPYRGKATTDGSAATLSAARR